MADSGTMRAAILSPDPAGAPVRPGDWPVPRPGAGEVRVRIVRAALNRNDAMIVDERTDIGREAVIGADGAGVVDALGTGVAGMSPGDEVVISPSLDWGDDPRVQGPDYSIVGFPTQGTHAEYVVVPAANVFAKPSRLTWDETAALPMAALTAWRALVTRGGVAAGQRVLVTGASGGVATFAVQIAAALGAEVSVTTSSRETLERAMGLGARDGAMRGPDEVAALAGRVGAFDVVLDSAGAHWPALLAALRPGGTMVSIGRTASDEAAVPLFDAFWRQLSIVGSSMGTNAEFAALLDHVAGASWRPVIDRVYGLSEIAAAYERLNGAHFGKVVIDPAR